MPGPEEHMAALSEALLPDGVLGVFCPSVTQIGDCLRKIRHSGLRLGRDMVLEFPPHAEMVGAGLRGWNVKYTVAKAQARANVEAEATAAAAAAALAAVTGEEIGVEVGSGADGESASEGSSEPGVPDGGKEVLVCRPSVGERLVGGGFFGIFRKKGEC